MRSQIAGYVSGTAKLTETLAPIADRLDSKIFRNFVEGVMKRLDAIEYPMGLVNEGLWDGFVNGNEKLTNYVSLADRQDEAVQMKIYAEKREAFRNYVIQ